MSELTGAELDLAVAEAIGWLYGSIPTVDGKWLYTMEGDGCFNVRSRADEWHPSTNWGQLGPLIEERDVWLSDDDNEVHYASCRPHTNNAIQEGETKAIAACRAIIISKEEKDG